MMDEKRKGEIALKVLEYFFQPKFSLNFEDLSELTNIPERELREVIEPFMEKLMQRVESESMWREIMPEKNNQ